MNNKIKIGNHPEVLVRIKSVEYINIYYITLRCHWETRGGSDAGDLIDWVPEEARGDNIMLRFIYICGR